MTGDRLRARRALHRLADRQRGYFTAAQAEELGYSRQARKYHLDTGGWTRAGSGIYRIADWPASNDEHLVVLTLWSRGMAVVSHESALERYGVGDVNPAHTHLTVPPGFRKRSRSVVLHRQYVPDSDIRDHGGYRMTTPARAIAEAAADALSQELVDGAIEDAIGQGLTTPRRLREVAARLGSLDSIEHGLRGPKR